MNLFGERLRSRLLEYFNPSDVLGFNCTLLDCDFKDTFRCYPYEALDFYSKNGLGESYFRQQFSRYKKDLTRLSFIQNEDLENKIEMGVLTQSNEKYTDVSLEYLNKFPDGVVFLSDDSFRFYFSSICFVCSDGRVCELDSIIDNFVFSISKMIKIESKLSSFSLNQKSVVADLLQGLFLYSPVEYDEARNALEAGWCQYLSVL